MKLLVFLLSFLFPFVASQAGSQELYRWIDETGKIHIGDEINRVPEKYRHGIKIYRTSSGPRKRSPIQKRAVPVPAPKITERQEQTEIATHTEEERNARIEALRQEKDKLEQEKNRQRILQRRFGTVRATFYKKRVQQLDQEIEDIQKELEVIRPKGQ